MRHTVRRWLDQAITAVDPERLTAEALEKGPPEFDTVIGVGKAAPGMCRGAATALGGNRVRGICVGAEPADVPDGFDLLIGDHPIPGAGSFEAGRRVLEAAASSRIGCLVLVSGGGSALCEHPRAGVEPDYLIEVNRRLLMSGASIEETNLVRAHISALKCGGLARAGDVPFHTYVLSDVAGAGPEVVASGPTLPMRYNPEAARQILVDIGMDVPTGVWTAMLDKGENRPVTGHVSVVGDGRTAAEAVVEAALRDGVEAQLMRGWLTGETENAVTELLTTTGGGLTVAAGETYVVVSGGGRGGRNTHAALLAAVSLRDTDCMFAAFATDGVDGTSGAAGAIIDGGTLERGGDPAESIESFDSATYLARTGDLIETGPTGTNVADLWLLWRR